MKFHSKGSVYLAGLIIVLSPLQSNNTIVQSDLYSDKRLISADDAVNTMSYLSSFLSSHKEYLQTHTTSPCIQCKKCNTKILDLSEFDGGLIGWALHGLAKGNVFFEKIKSIFGERLKVVSEKSPADIVSFMIRVANDTKQLCSDCHSNSDMWEKVL